MATPPRDFESSPVAGVGAVTAGAAGILAAWIAAGSIGLMAHPLRIALTLVALLVAAVTAWQAQHRQRILLLCVLTVLGLPLVLRPSPTHHVLLVSAVLGLLAAGQRRTARLILLITAQAALTLGIFRLACLSIPAVWLAANTVGGVLGQCAGELGGRPLSVGTTFAGLDFLVLMAALGAGWLRHTQGPRFARAIYVIAAVCTAQLLYLVTLSYTPELLQWLPTPDVPEPKHPYVPPPWEWSEVARTLVPWNLPLLACLFHLGVAIAMLRWATWHSDEYDSPQGGDHQPSHGWLPSWAKAWAPLLIAVLLSVIATLSMSQTDLSHKTIVASQQGDGDWLTPQHDNYGQPSAGTFGMLPMLVESLGGRLHLSADLSDDDLKSADVLLLLRPPARMPEPQKERVWQFVRRGGALLVAVGPLAGPRSAQRWGHDLLEPFGMRIREDVAISETGNWQHAIDRLAHPVTYGIDDRTACCFTDSAASIQVTRPARPLVVGRWGWSDPGSGALPSSVPRMETGERTGDLVLAAEQPFGKGTVAVLGDDFALTNEGGVRGYAMTGRLLSYLATRNGNPQAAWRQAASFVLCLALLVCAARGADAKPKRLVWTASLLAVSLAVTGMASRYATRVVPDGWAQTNPDAASNPVSHRLAYIDASHLEAYSDRHWGFDGINGLALNLMRNGYLALTLPEITAERLQRAALVVSIAPARPFTARQRKLLHGFVENGGMFICTAGGEEASAGNPLLEDFGIRIPVSPVPTRNPGRKRGRSEPEPMGRFRSIYLEVQDAQQGNYQAGVTFHAGWPVEAVADGSEVLAYGQPQRPIIVARNIGQGKVVVIGDTSFAMNKNLEYYGGEPFDGNYENAHFWRWLLARITARPEWIPPRPPKDAGTDEEGES